MTTNGNPSTVLIVDDEKELVDLFAHALDEYDVRKAYGGEEALEKTDETVDAVLLDRKMPDLSGGDVLDEIRQRDLDVRVAMVTAVDPDFDITEMDFDAYVTKPVDEEELREVVDELLSLSDYDETVRDLFAVAEKKAALEATKTEEELAASSEYDRLQERETELDARAVDSIDSIDGNAFEKLLSGFPDGSTE